MTTKNGPPTKGAMFPLGVVVAVTGLVVALTYTRLFYGVDLNDEAFYIVVPYRYLLGATPIVDEVNISQLGAGALASPLLAGYYHAFGLDGIVLFSRHLYFLFAAGLSVALFVSMRVVLRDALLALSASLLALAFIPFNHPSLNYNSLANGFFTAGCFLGLAYAKSGRAGYLFAAGATHGLAVFAYPPLIVPVVVFSVALYAVTRSRGGLLRYLAIALLGAAAWLMMLFSGGSDAARDFLAHARSVNAGRDVGIERAISVVRDAVANFPLAPLAVAAAITAALVYRRHPRLSVALLLLLPLLALPARPVALASPGAAVHYATNLGLLALPLLMFFRHEPLARRLMMLVWIPAFAAGWAISWSTFDDGGHQGIGFFAAAIVTAILLATAIDRVTISIGGDRHRAIALLAPLVSVGVFVALQYSAAPHELAPWRLDRRVASGPYAGLLTTQAKDQFMRELRQNVADVTSRGSCSILFYYDFPAGYLMTTATPETNTSFLYSREPHRHVFSPWLRAYFEDRGELPDVAVRLTEIPQTELPRRPRYVASDVLDRLIRSSSYERVVREDSYAVYVEKRGPCAS